IAFLTVREFTRQRAAIESPFTAHEIPRLACRLACTGCINRLADDAASDRRILLEKRSEFLIEDRLDDALHFRVAEFRLRLSFELRARNFDADDSGQPLAYVITRDALFEILRERVLRRIRVDCASERRAEPREMCAALV